MPSMKSDVSITVKESDAIDYQFYGSMRAKGFVYLISGLQWTKIGISICPEERIIGISSSVPFEVKIIAIVPTDNMLEMENMLHKKYAHKRVKGEWFLLSSQDIDEIKSYIPNGFEYTRKKRGKGKCVNVTDCPF